MTTLRIATVNVNGIRASVRRGFGQWLQRCQADVIAVQEVRCPAEAVPAEAWPEHGFSYDPGSRAGRNGVGVLSRWAPSAVRSGFGNRTFDSEGRHLEGDLGPPDAPPITVGSLYLPKGGNADYGPEYADKQRRKLRFMASFGRYLTAARRTAQRTGREFVVLGDFNIAHTRNDLANPSANTRQPGFMPPEREWFGNLLGPRTLVDVVRALHPDARGPFSWWTWRGQAWGNDTGWRIDYHLATPALASAAVSGGTDREPSYEERISDHSPVLVDYTF